METFAKAHSPMLHELARTHGTPLYVYDMERIKRNFLSFKQAFSGRKSLICYALKANANLSILKLLAQLGSGADCVSIGEVRRALLAGIPRYKIIFSGVGKRDDEIEEALRENILFLNVESFEELKRIESIAKSLADSRTNPSPESTRARISIRVNPNIDAKTHPYISTGLHENKFGVDIDTAKQMYLYAHKSSMLEPVGIHFHIGSQLTDLSPLIESSHKIAQLARSLVALGISLRFFDIGGGLGIRYEDEKPIDLYAYAQGILSTLSGCDWTVICEPGRRIVGDSGLLLTQVIGQKHTSQKRFVIVDAGMNDLMRPALYGAFHQPILLGYGRDSVLGSHSPDWEHFRAVTTDKVAPTLKCSQSKQSATTTPRILEEENEKSTENQKVDSSTATTLNEQAQDSRISKETSPNGERCPLFCNEKPLLFKPRKEIRLECLSTQLGAEIKGLSRKAESSSAQKLTPADIVGPVCESSDVFCRDFALPEMQGGELIGFGNAGAYGHSMSSTYNARLRPAEVGIYTDENGAHAKLLRRAESFAESVQNELEALESNYPKTLESH